MSFDKPLVKQERKKYLYTEEEAIVEHVKLAVTAKTNEIIYDEQFFSKVIEYLKKYTIKSKTTYCKRLLNILLPIQCYTTSNLLAIKYQ